MQLKFTFPSIREPVWSYRRNDNAVVEDAVMMTIFPDALPPSELSFAVQIGLDANALVNATLALPTLEPLQDATLVVV